MLTELRIENIILIESARLTFGEGFNVLTGETGAGKSAVLQGLALVTGKRAECSLIRRGADKGTVDAIFEVDASSPVHALLEEAGISYEAGEALHIRREISCQGRSRSFVNGQQVHLNTLRALSPFLLEMVAQHATQSLLSLDYHRHVVDSYGELKPQVSSFSKSHAQELALERELEQLLANQERNELQLEQLQQDISEIEDAKLQDNEEDDLFAEYTRLVNVENTEDKLNRLDQLLGDESGITNLFRQAAPLLDELAKIDPKLQELSTSLQNARIEIQEASYSLGNYRGRLECDPARVEEVNDRLSLIRRLKRKFGPSLDDVFATLKDSKQRADELSKAYCHIPERQRELQELRAVTSLAAAELSEKRKQTAETLATELTKRLHALNMPHARFQVDIRTEARTSTGDDRIEFYIAPNLGEDLIPARECASGGELSRIMLALTALLSKKDRIPTLVFDEIDANIGGETASKVGAKLRELGEEHQILCITHFPQVAQAAHQHLRILKRERNGRTFTEVLSLDTEGRLEELSRMLGGEALATLSTSETLEG